MRRLVLFTLWGLLPLFSLQAEIKTRAVHYGMTPGDVKRIEPGSPLKDQLNLLSYDDFLLGVPVKVKYLFRDEKLFSFYYSISLRKVEAEAYNIELLDALKKKYQQSEMAFGIYTFNSGQNQVNYLFEQRGESSVITLIYTQGALASIDSELLGDVKEQIRRMVAAAKARDIREKI